MNKRRALFVMLTATMVMSGLIMFAENGDQTGHGQPDPPGARVYYAKGQAGNRGGKPSSPNMVLHGGDIMPTASVTAIFWGTSWTQDPNTAAGQKIAGLETFYRGLLNTP